ncbi:hypothetical protein EV132_1616 [Rhizobium sullae]|uniref:Uncharacterized protein n=1 Tax=Rhizobium sullae TaxID=50338 RepID=A0A4V2V7R4_RHISU|nr:hypothetical protein EV132_1616 [Rhizobium sullae]
MADRSLGTRRENGSTRLVYLTFYILGFAGRKIGMGHRMVGDVVTFRHDPPDEVRLLFRKHTDHKKCGRHAVFSQDIQYLWRRKWVRTVVKRQINAAIIGASNGHFA